MEGFLLDTNFLFFLLPHSLTLILVSVALKFNKGKKITLFTSNISPLLLGIITCIYSFVASKYLLILSGIVSAFLLLKIIVIISQNSSRPKIIAYGLIAGNISSVLLFYLPATNTIKILLLSTLIIMLFFIKKASNLNLTKDFQSQHVFHYKFLVILPIFYITSGWFYDIALPSYFSISIYKGLEIVFYITAIAIGVKLIERYKENLLASAFMIAIISIAVFTKDKTATEYTSVFLSQFSFGLSDLFLLWIATNIASPFSLLIMSLTTFAIAAGDITSHYLILSLLTTKIVTVSILSINFFIIFMLKEKDQIPQKDYKYMLSQQEQQVFNLMLKNKSLKEIASNMDISLSSVKTYASRIYKKFNVKNKKELIKKIKNNTTD